MHIVAIYMLLLPPLNCQLELSSTLSSVGVDIVCRQK